MIKVLAVSAPKQFWRLQKKIPELLTRLLSLPKLALVNVVFLSAAKAQKFNWQLRRRRYVPDVLSLNFNTYRSIGVKSALPLLGELYLCWPQIQKQARLNGKKSEQELAWVLIHGLLHLLGYDHEQSRPALAMRALEQKILTQF